MIKQSFTFIGFVKMANRLYNGRIFISPKDQQELDYLYHQTGFRAHKVDNENNRFKSFPEVIGSEDAKKVESIMSHYARRGFIFTNNAGVLLGHVCTVSTTSDRAAVARAGFKIVK